MLVVTLYQRKMQWYELPLFFQSTFLKVLLVLIVLASLSYSSGKISLVLYEEDLIGLNSTAIKDGLGAASYELHYQSLPKQSGINKHVLSSPLLELLKTSDFVISFLNGMDSRLFDDVLGSNGLKHMTLSPQDCHIGYKRNSHLLPRCNEISSEVNEALLMLLHHLEGSKMAILTSNEPCSRTFAGLLVKDISKKQRLHVTRKKTNVSMYEFAENPLDVKEISILIQKIKILKPTALLLACPLDVQKVVLRVAARYAMLGYENIWVIPTLDDALEARLIPMQLITVRRTVHAHQLPMLENWQVVSAIKHAAEIMKNPNQSSQLSVGGNHSTLPACRSNKLSKVTVLAKSDKTSDWTIVYMKDKSSNYQFYADNGLVMSIFNTEKRTTFLRMVTVIDAPFTMEVPYLRSSDGNNHQCERGLVCRLKDPGGNTTSPGDWRYSCCIGHSMDLLAILMQKLSLSVDLYIVEDGFYGSLVNGSFNGMIGDVAAGKADVAIAGVTITSQRSKAVDFTSPFIRQDIGIVTMTKREALPFINWQFAYPVDNLVIIIVFMGILLGTFLTYAMENQEVVVRRLLDPKQNPPRYSWREGFTYYSGLTFQRDLGGKNPSEFGSRVVAIGFAFAMLVVMTTYTAVLTATKVAQRDPNPFLGIKDQRMRNPTPDFKFATVPSTSIESFFKNAPDETFRRMYLFMQNYNVRTVQEGLKQVQSGKIQAFIHEYPFLLYFLSKQSKCELKITGEPVGQSGFALALKKGSPWTERLSYEILKLTEADVLADLNKKWLSASCSEQSNNLHVPESLSLEYFGGLVLFISITFGAMFLMLPIEYAYRRYPRKHIDSLANSISTWKQAREHRMALKARPTLKSISSESTLITFDMERRPVTII